MEGLASGLANPNAAVLQIQLATLDAGNELGIRLCLIFEVIGEFRVYAVR